MRCIVDALAGFFLVLHAFVIALIALVWIAVGRAIFDGQWLAGYTAAMAVFALCYRGRAVVKPRPVAASSFCD